MPRSAAHLIPFTSETARLASIKSAQARRANGKSRKLLNALARSLRQGEAGWASAARCRVYALICESSNADRIERLAESLRKMGGTPPPKKESSGKPEAVIEPTDSAPPEAAPES